MKLNHYVAASGICSRRKASELIKEGEITVNHYPVTDPSYEVQEKDTIRYKKKEIKPESYIYILLNKPAKFLSVRSDAKGRPTVFDLIDIKQRINPVGRLDYDTTGLLLLTNDGELNQKLAHPKHEVPKTYQVVIDRQLDHKDVLKLQKGVRLEDGKVVVDEIAFVDPSKLNIKVTLHSGKYRVIRRLFAFLGYDVLKLDRVAYAGLTKKGLPQGAYRRLRPQEIEMLKSL